MSKPDLQRIETTLEQLEQADTPPSVATREPSFSLNVQPFSVQKPQGKTPDLPKLKPIQISTHRHGANPALATTLLQEIQEIVGGWQKELQQILKQIQDLYLEGPIVDGWLDSHAREAEVGVAEFRHAEVDRLMDYVEEMINQSQDSETSVQSPRAGYRLCGLDPDGQVWSRPCPPEQVASVSMAIARYQKLRQLLNRKQDLEIRLTQLAETLVILHSHLGESI